MFSHRFYEDSARVIIKVADGLNESFTTKQLDVPCCRVFPINYKEVSYLQSLTAGYSVFAPADGDGLIVKAAYLPLN